MSMIMFHPIMMTVDDRDDEKWSMGSDDDIGYWAAADHGNGDWKRCWKTVDRLISCRIKGIKYLIWRPRCRQPLAKPESRGSHKIVTGGAHCRSRSSKITNGARSPQIIIKVAQLFTNSGKIRKLNVLPPYILFAAWQSVATKIAGTIFYFIFVPSYRCFAFFGSLIFFWG